MSGDDLDDVKRPIAPGGTALWTEYTEEFELTGKNKIWPLVTG